MRGISVFLALFSFFFVEAQIYNTGFHIYNDHAFSSCIINDNLYYSSEDYTKGFVDTSYVTSLNKIGQLRFRKKLIKHEYTHIEKLVPCSDKSIVMVGQARGCDYINNSAKTFILKLDTLGNIIFDNTFTNYYPNGPDNLKCVVQVSDSSFYCVSDSVLFHFNKNGGLIKRKNTGLTLLNALTNYSPNRFIVCGNTSGTFKHFILDTSGSIINQSISWVSVNKYEMLSSGSVIALCSNKTIKKLNQNLTSSDSSNTTQGSNILLTDLNVNQDTIFSCGYNSVNRTPTYIKFDSVFNKHYQFNSVTQNVIPVSINTGSDDAILVTNCTSDFTVSTPSFNGITKIGKQGSYTYTNDIGVTGIIIDSSNVTANYGSIMNVTKYTADYRLKVTVKNFGGSMINSFYLNHFIKYMISCGYDIYHQLFTNVSLAPGASTILTTPVIFGVDLGVFPGPPVSGNYSITNLCVFTTLPDGKNDGVISNDDFCGNSSVPYVTSIENIQGSNAYFKTYPNPVSDKLFFESTSDFDEIKIYDVTGKTVITEKFKHTPNKAIDVADLPSGFYVAKINFEGKPIKVVKLLK